MELDYRDFYIGFQGNPNFQVNKIITDDLIRVVIQKYEMILFTNKGELYGDPNFGCDLYKILHETNVSALTVKNIIIEQISNYITELVNINYTLEVSFQEDPINYHDILIIDFSIKDYEVKAAFF